MEDLVIRRANVNDTKTITALDRLCFATPWSEASFRDELANNKLALYIIAEIGETPVGYAGIWLILDEGHVTNVAVHPAFRRKHIGAALVGVLTDFCDREGIVAETLEVRPSNTAALGLYESFGFKEQGRRKKYYDDNGEDAIIMWRGTRSAE